MKQPGIKAVLYLSVLVLPFTTLVRAETTSHQRLWITTNDLARLRSWATPANPIYAEGLAVQAENAKTEMDVAVTREDNLTIQDVPYRDGGSREYEAYPTEQYAELFAYLSLVSTNAAVQVDYARRATNLLMYAMNQAVLGPDTNEPAAPFRGPLFYTYDSNRARWNGEGWALTVDWIYPYLSAADKATIRKVFLLWASEIVSNTYPRSPQPEGVTNDPILYAEGTLFGSPFNPVRWAGNNYFCAHMRNLGLMAMAFDAADDPGNQLRNYLSPATGAFLYLVDALLRGDCRGGLLPEGPEYSPQTAAYIMQFLLGLHTAGQDNAAVWGPQVVLTNQPFCGDFIYAYLNSVSPRPGLDPTDGQNRPFYYAACYGDSQAIRSTDFIHSLGPLGSYAYQTGDSNRWNSIRWMELNLPPGSVDGFVRRLADGPVSALNFSDNIFYFMLYDPAAAAPPDPHSAEPLDWFAPGMQRILSRTSWDTNATWFTYKLGWSHIAHQLCDGNQFELFRRGEWLTRERTGYSLDAGSSDDHNTLALENDLPARFVDPKSDTNDYRYLMYLRGSQWGFLSDPDPQIVSVSLHPSFVAVTGDATALYNSSAENSTNILHASRSLLWLKPDHLIIYDRAASRTSGRFKRFWLNTATNAIVTGNRATVTMASGQGLFCTTLLPTDAVVTSELYVIQPDGAYGQNPSVAAYFSGESLWESMAYWLRVEAPGGPPNVRFLNVIQGADAGTVASEATLVQSTNGTEFAGAVVANTAVLFPIDLNAAFNGMTYFVPFQVATHLITGLTPNAGYSAARVIVGAGERVTVSSGGPSLADSGGVLALQLQPPLVLSFSVDAGTNVLLSVDGAAGRTVYIQSSTNLTTWTTLGQATNGSNNQLQLGDRFALGQRARFYHAVAN